MLRDDLIRVQEHIRSAKDDLTSCVALFDKYSPTFDTVKSSIADTVIDLAGADKRIDEQLAL